MTQFKFPHTLVQTHVRSITVSSGRVEVQASTVGARLASKQPHARSYGAPPPVRLLRRGSLPGPRPSLCQQLVDEGGGGLEEDEEEEERA